MTGLVRNEQPLATEDRTVSAALVVLTDTRLTIEDRAGAYGVLHQVQLRINRALKKVKDDLISYMVAQDIPALGPLTVKATPIDVEWPINDEGNWGDFTAQDELAMYQKIAPEYIRLVPEHLEIRTAELGKGVYEGDPVAIQLHSEAKARRWRTEVGRRLSLAVKEVRESK